MLGFASKPLKTGVACLSVTVLGLDLQQHWQLEMEIHTVNTRQGFLVRQLFLLKPPQNLVLLKCMAEVEEHQRQVQISLPWCLFL